MKDSVGPGWQPLEVNGTRAEFRTNATLRPADRLLWPSVGEYPVYDEFLYSAMVQDEARNTLFERAITEQAPGRVAVELGAGPDLLWSSLAARSAASRVFAVETLEPSVRAARRRAEALGPHVTVFHGDATQITLPAKGDMCIVELVGAIGGAEGIADVVADAWRRHLEPDAVVVPHRVRTRIAAVGAGGLLGGDPAVHPDVFPYVEEVLRSAGSVFDLRMCLTGLTAADLMTTADVLEDLNLGANIQTHRRQLRLEVTRPGAIDSGLLWLELQCAPDQEILDSLATVTTWMPVLLPFDLEQPVSVQPGDVLLLDVARRLYDAVHPEWVFDGAVYHRAGSSTAVCGKSAYARGGFRRSWLHRALLREPA